MADKFRDLNLVIELIISDFVVSALKYKKRKYLVKFREKKEVRKLK